VAPHERGPQRKQEQQLLEFIHGAEGFGETHKDDRNQAVTRALNQAMMHLGLLSKVWMVRDGMVGARCAVRAS